MQHKNAFERRLSADPVARSWKGVELEVKQWQQQIARASERGERAALYRLQQECMASESARQLAVRRVTEMNAGKDTAGVDGVKSLTPSERAEMDFLGFHLHQEENGTGRSGQNKPGVQLRTIIEPTQDAHQRHLSTLDQRLLQLQVASPEQVIVKLNPLIAGFTAYYVGLVEPATLLRYNGLLEQRLLAWASHRHPGMTREGLLARYWRSGPRTRQFVAPDGTMLRQYG
jgi:hypothetical protein